MKKIMLTVVAGILMITASCQKDVKQDIAVADTLGTDLLEKKSLAYDYPIKPGTEAWKKLSTKKEMIDVCQIPENVLFTLTSEELMDVCLAYPLLNDIFAYISVEEGVTKLFQEFNGIRELSKRKDAIRLFLEEYKRRLQNIDALAGAYTDVAKGDFIIGLSTLELLVSNSAILKSATDINTVKEAVQILYDGYNKKIENVAYFKGIPLKTNLFSRHLAISHKDGTVVDKSVKSFQFDAISIDKINDMSKKIINK